jgi:glycogen debranching enzyme
VRTAAVPHATEVLAGPGTVTVISGLTFAISDERGDLHGAHGGLIAADVRHVSLLELRIDGEPLQPLGAGVGTPDAVRFRFYVTRPGTGPDATIEVERSRRVSAGAMHEEVTITSWDAAPVELRVTLRADADFADIFEVRQPHPSGGRTAEDRHEEPGRIRLQGAGGTRATVVGLTPPSDEADADGRHWRIRVERGSPWRLAIDVVAVGAGAGWGEAGPARDERPVSVVSAPAVLGRAVARSLDDLDRLTLPDRLDGRRMLLAAGIPWYVALFGRDTIISSLQARAFQPWRMLDTLGALAARQGRVDDPGAEEQPGKILHEVRFSERAWLGEGTTGGARPYYGSVDATPLFVILAGVARRWGAPREALQALLPALTAAMDWMRGPGDADGDGFIEYRARGGRRLANQGWKDSHDAIQWSDGRFAEGPLALVEVQGYAYRARRELAAILDWCGDGAAAEALHAEADALRDAIRARFWIPGGDGAPGWFALALDGAKGPVDAVASNMGHLLWCGVPSNAEAEQVAQRLVAPDMASGWGLRTLSTAMDGYNPISYHLGSVWPHDTVFACAGLRQYGLDAEAMTLVGALLDALEVFDDRLPELFGGHGRDGPAGFPVPYPTACRPQAWAAGVPLALVPLLLGLEPSMPDGHISLSPVLPPDMESLSVRGIPLGGGSLSVTVGPGGVSILGVPPGTTVNLRPAVGPAGGGAGVAPG